MRRGEVWWARLDGREAVVLLSDERDGEFEAIRVVAAATDEQRRGFVLLSGAEALEPGAFDGIDVDAGAEIEIEPAGGVIRVAFPRDGRIYCTWRLTVGVADLAERAGELTLETLRQVEGMLRLSSPTP